MKNKLLFLLLTLLIAPTSLIAAETCTVDIEFSFTAPDYLANQLVGYKLYKENVQVCATNDPNVSKISCQFPSEAGSFDFSLTAYYANGAESPPSPSFPFTIASVTGTPTPAPTSSTSPIAILSSSTAAGNAPLKVTFDGTSSTTPNWRIVSYDWSFGDGSQATGATTSHTFTTAGTYYTQLTVVDNRGLSNKVSTPIVVIGSAPANQNPIDVTGDNTTLPKPSAGNVADMTSIWDEMVIPTILTANDTSAVELGMKFQSSVDGYITGIRFYKGPGNTGIHLGNLWTASGKLLASVTFANETASGWQYQAFPEPVAITANTTYVSSYHTNTGYYSYDAGYFNGSGFDKPLLRALTNSESGGNGVYLYGAGGFPNQTWNATNYWVDVTFTTTLPVATTSAQLWDDSYIPATLSAADTGAVELGVKFKSSIDGFITALRFYKAAENTGTHVGNLWSARGSLLASVIFTNETRSGWQEMSLPTPVPISANTTYVASYHTNVGHYSVDTGYFDGSGFDNPLLRALTDSESGGNGVYLYGNSGFPNQTWNASNYWVDVVFTP
ncbi:DUF4082 domain-containing protein [Desulfopila sp. IMCC35006]|uniref:DUF4082 domain-containing protein n=1 Tax=Desulfopila sp. IMCC35006 TaxID=2569542 RepID=UPI0010AC95D9|nr:DUF4082 domain-containing protein [Desulfopila sp. IMCC35006]TKB23978.1 DUF4082 domain-containing protein [Desulfopila sp. IMCC35006]